MSAISDKYAALGGPGGFLGGPLGPESPTPDGVGSFRHYQFGSIYWTPQTGAHEVHGAIREKWAALGWENFGYPATDETGTPDGVGRFNHFHNIQNNGDSSIYWTPQTDAHEVHGAIREKWASLGWEHSGYPVTDETGTPDGMGRFNHFHNIQNNGDSSIYWTPQTGAHEVHGAIREKWASLGWERSWLGYPSTDEFQTADLTWQCNHFQNGSIIWSRIGWPTESGAQPHRAGRSGSVGESSPLWGLLANPGFESRAMKSVYFFAGDWKFGIQRWYEYFSCPNDALYTLHPSDARHLGWSENQKNRDFALDAMVEAGVNVINLSYWGKRGTDRWAFWAPMHCSTFAHDQVFDTALSRNILIAPYIESSGATNFDPRTGKPFQCGTAPNGHTGNSPGYDFGDDFPGDFNTPAPALVDQIRDLIDRYLLAPGNPQWPSRWAQVYDRLGGKRYVISIIHACSNQLGVDDQSFAAGLDRVADALFAETGISVGFTLDPLPGTEYSLTPSAGPALTTSRSFLAIEPFISEIALGTDDLRTLLPLKQGLMNRWLSAGVPVILDVSPGYDAHIVFPAPNNGYQRIANDDIWHNGQTQMIVSNAGSNSVRGITFNTWNGFTEGYAAVPTLEYGGQAFTWLQSLFNLLP